MLETVPWPGSSSLPVAVAALRNTCRGKDLRVYNIVSTLKSANEKSAVALWSSWANVGDRLLGCFCSAPGCALMSSSKRETGDELSRRVGLSKLLRPSLQSHLLLRPFLGEPGKPAVLV